MTLTLLLISLILGFTTTASIKCLFFRHERIERDPVDGKIYQNSMIKIGLMVCFMILFSLLFFSIFYELGYGK
jgi:hypothetical protein